MFGDQVACFGVIAAEQKGFDLREVVRNIQRQVARAGFFGVSVSSLS